MKSMIPFLTAKLPVATVAQSQSVVSPGVPSVAIPETTGVIVIQTAKLGVTPQQVMAVMPAEIRATEALFDRPRPNARCVRKLFPPVSSETGFGQRPGYKRIHAVY